METPERGCRVRRGRWPLLGLMLALSEPPPPESPVPSPAQAPAVAPPGSGCNDAEDIHRCVSGVLTPPVLLSGPPVEYPPEAVRERVRGVVLVRCTVTLEGRAEACRILKGLPHLDAAVLRVMAGRRYRPMTWEGAPLESSFTFRFDFRLAPP